MKFQRMGTTKDIREAVRSIAQFDPLVNDADLHVVNMNGDVPSTAPLPSYPQYLEAASSRSGVAA